MSAVDPAFLKFFAGEWQGILESVAVPGMSDPSWDRKAAWLVFTGFNPAVDQLPKPKKKKPSDLDDLL